ncbi:polyhydroxyalkanoate synthesis repressor PhaR [Psychrobium sp. 1_MG-2023]|uniref:polyhydroxyalkanoate synthesis repressor PhaR n=1 Tax=Psychrobium sp. 1_MG-2023 TaxID=3062624 RepID=UPI000C33F5F7|nr:polyhydroxyalkanoate synthesis repressor PhaR [Psychrobium sp. 1_MG-2023]MDP2559762.1 polyhydroxyalkanoate synthesis repressor PhaR [Psychrobium sp. 1_MG-2023]PKF59130.1 polyhydroxyalkanoate synthesis repressor PhaR [Alteromonadales bacterium alter-6D02]
MPRIIKKYPNRRLYDTEQSKYITLSNIKDLVMAGIEFQVVDKNTDEDITRTILLQIIMDEESNGRPLFSENTLSHLIRFYGGAVQGVFGQYLEDSLSAFTKQQHLFTPSEQDPLKSMTDMAQQNMKMWTDMQNSFFQSNQNNKDKS